MEYEAGWDPDMVLHFEGRETCLCQDLKLMFARNYVKAAEQIFMKFGIGGFYLKILGFVKMDQ
jgi:hypothetical protein